MIDLDRISPSTLRDIVSQLRDAGVAKVRWSYIWYDDQADPDQIECFDVSGNPVDLHTAARISGQIENDLYQLSNDDYGDYELNAYTGEVEYIGGEPWRVPTSYGGEGRDDYDVSPIDEADLDICDECGCICDDQNKLLETGLCEACQEKLEQEEDDETA